MVEVNDASKDESVVNERCAQSIAGMGHREITRMRDAFQERE